MHGVGVLEFVDDDTVDLVQHRLPHGEVGAEQVLSPGDHVSKVDQAERLLAGLIGRHHLLRAGDQAGQVQLSIGQRAGMAGQHIRRRHDRRGKVVISRRRLAGAVRDEQAAQIVPDLPIPIQKIGRAINTFEKREVFLQLLDIGFGGDPGHASLGKGCDHDLHGRLQRGSRGDRVIQNRPVNRIQPRQCRSDQASVAPLVPKAAQEVDHR